MMRIRKNGHQHTWLTEYFLLYLVLGSLVCFAACQPYSGNRKDKVFKRGIVTCGHRYAFLGVRADFNPRLEDEDNAFDTVNRWLWCDNVHSLIIVFLVLAGMPIGGIGCGLSQRRSSRVFWATIGILMISSIALTGFPYLYGRSLLKTTKDNPCHFSRRYGDIR
jgi:hypothetical protein